MQQIKTAIITIVISCLFGAGVPTCTEPSASPPTPSVPSRAPIPVSHAPESFAVPENQRRLVNEYRRSLAVISATSSRARELLSFYDSHVLSAMMEPNGAVRASERMDNSHPRFFIVAELYAHTGSLIAGAARFTCAPFPVLIVRSLDVTDLVRGVLLAHELVHARDCILGGEPTVLGDDRVWIMGELHAHAVEAQILHDITDGRWSEAVRQTQLRYARQPEAQHTAHRVGVFQLADRDTLFIRAIFGRISADSMAPLVAQLNIESNLLHARVYAEQNRLPAEERQLRDIAVARGLFGLFREQALRRSRGTL